MLPSLTEPSWWYARPPGRWANLLEPVAQLYGHIARRRLEYARPYTSRIPVICVGNFTAGGTGKTPTALRIAELLRGMGEAPAFLTRGYGGSIPGPHWVEPATDTARRTGDEPLLLARSAPTMIARNRAAGARAMEVMAEPPSVIVMDDGLQNPSLAKSIRIGLIDGRRGVGNGRMIPAGPLRAPLATQLSLVDGIIISGGSSAGADAPDPEAFRVGEQVLAAAKYSGPLLRSWVAPRLPEGVQPEKPVVAFAGIANPDRFFETLRACGIVVARAMRFKDHYEFTAGDAEDLLRLSERLDAPLITTEKDIVRLRGHDDARANLADRAIALPIMIEFTAADLEKLLALLKTAVTVDEMFLDG